MDIFREYDIRGIYPKEIDEKKAKKIGLAVAVVAKREKIFLSYDNRVGSLKIKDSFINGLLDGGVVVYNSGLYPITVSAFASFIEKSYGVCVTASHNPAEYTGILMFKDGTGMSVTPDKIKSKMSEKPAKTRGHVVDYDYSSRYIDYISKGVGKLNLKIGIDSMGGSTTYIAKRLFESLGAKTYNLHQEMSSDFYGKTPEPSAKNAKNLQRFVKSKNLDIGIQLDADGDRVLFVDEKGEVVDPMTSAMIFIKNLHFRSVAATVGCSMLLENYAKVKYIKVGRPHVESALRNKKYDFGVETSSHFYFNKYYPFSDGLLAAVLMAGIIKKSNKKFSQLASEFPKSYHGETAVKIKTNRQADMKIKNIKRKMIQYGKGIYIDGVKTQIKDGFILFRKSNTEPLIRGNYESKTESTAKYLKKIMEEVIR